MTRPQKTAKELGHPEGTAVLRDGKVIVLPHDHGLDRQRQTEIGPAPSLQIATPGTQTVNKTSAMDRADGFVRSTSRLAPVTALFGLIIGAWADIAPLWSLTMLFGVLTVYAMTWAFAWIIYQIWSPDGAVILSVLLTYKNIKREQEYRHGRNKK